MGTIIFPAANGEGQPRLLMELGQAQVPKRREPKPDRGHADLPLFDQPDTRQMSFPETEKKGHE